MKNTNFIIIAAVAALFIGCNKDLGNYDYSEKDTLFVSGIPDTVSAQIGQSPEIYLDLKAKLGSVDESELTFEWCAYDQSISDKTKQKQILSRKKDLNSGLPLKIGSYKSFLTVRNKRTGNIWTYPFRLLIEGAYGKYGWFILSDQNGEAHIDFQQDDPKAWNTYPIAYKDFNNLLLDLASGESFTLTGKPISIEFLSNRDIINTAFKNFVYVNTDQKTYKINVSDGMTYNSVTYNFLNETVLGEPNRADYVLGISSGGAYVMKDNDIYSLENSQQKYYNVPANKKPDGSRYNVSNYPAIPMGNISGNMILFDTDNRRFMRLSLAAATATSLSSPDKEINVGDTKMDLVWLGHSSAFGGQAVAIMKDGTKFYLIRMTFTSSAIFSVDSVTEITSLLPEIANAKHFAVDNFYGYVFYATDNKLYQYDMDSKIVKLAKDYSDRTISLIKFNHSTNNLAVGSPAYIKQAERLEPVGYSIIVGTYNEENPTNSGKVEFWRVNALMGPLTESFKPFEGMGKVVDITYLDIS